MIKNQILCLFIAAIIYLIFFTIFSNTLLCEGPSFVEQMSDGTIPRRPLLKEGETLEDLYHGIHSVTGGGVRIGCTGNGNVVRIIGICVSNPYSCDPTVYVPGNVYNKNFASVLYEVRAAGLQLPTSLNMDYNESPFSYTNGNKTQFVRNCLAHYNEPSMGRSGRFSITNKLLNNMAK